MANGNRPVCYACPVCQSNLCPNYVPLSEYPISYGPRREKTFSSWFPTRRHSSQSAQLQRVARTLKFHPVAGLDMPLFNKRITKALIRLRGDSGWSAPLLFINHRRQVFLRQGPYHINSVDPDDTGISFGSALFA